MKKLISCILALTMLGTTSIAVSENDSKAILLGVKSIIDIPENYTDFETNIDSEGNYTFTWSNDDDNYCVNVDTDKSGHITFYSNYNGDSVGDLSKYSRADAMLCAESFLKKVAPYAYEDANDTLVDDEANSRVQLEECMSFMYNRIKDGKYTIANDYASVAVQIGANGPYISSFAIDWNHNAKFNTPSNIIEDPDDAFFAVNKPTLSYTDYYDFNNIMDGVDIKQRLLYSFDNKYYMNAETGEQETEYVKDYSEIYPEDESFKASRAATMSEDDSSLTPGEIVELDNIAGLMSVDSIIDKINSTKLFNEVPKNAEPSYSTYQDDNNYYYHVNIDNGDDYWYFTANAQTGKLVSMFTSCDYKKSDAAYDTEAVQKRVDDFIASNYPELNGNLTAPEMSSDGYIISYDADRLVNGILYPVQGVNAEYDPNTKKFFAFSNTVNDSGKNFPSKDGCLSENEMIGKLKSTNPIVLTYVETTENEYTLCYTIEDMQFIEKDAFTGEDLYDYFSIKTYDYDDIAGHWAEPQIEKLAELGKGFEGTSFEPEKAITRGELKALLSEYFDVMDTEDNDNEPITREDAFLLIVQKMGYGDIAILNSIFKTDFVDDINISPDRVGALAILQGFGIISGDAEGVRAKDYLTRAEAAALVYNYMFYSVG